MEKKQINLKEQIDDENDKILLKLDTSCEEILLDLDTDLNLEQSQKSNLQSQREQIEDQNKLLMEDGPENDLIQLSITIPTCNSTRTIKVKPKITIIELTKKLENDLNLEENKNCSFRAYGQDLYDLNKTLEDYYLGNESTIELKIPTEGGSYNLFDFSSKNMEVEEPSKEEKCKPWRYAKSGLNLPGICKNKKCEAYNLQVICPQGYGIFNMAMVIYKLKCPQQ